MQTKTCSRCKLPWPLGDFYKGVKYYDGYNPTCKHCKKEINKLSKERNKEKYAETRAIKRQWLKSRYGLTLEEVLSMYQTQDESCAICRKHFPLFDKHLGLAVDHNHTTNRVRGLLCRSCNHLLGNCQDNTATLINAIEYLQGEEKHYKCDTQSDAP